MIALVYLATLIVAASADIITRNGNTLQIRFETSNLNALEMGKNQIYTRLPYGNENIQVTCTKINCFENGTLQASVNDVALSRYGQCQSWASNYQDDYKCIMQPFQSVLLTYDETQVYHVECRFGEPELTEVVGFNLIRLFVDCVPRIKADGRVDKPGVLNIHYINRERVSCEASQDRNAPQGFDDIQWFTYDTNQNLNLQSSKEDVTTLTTTYTNPFNPAYFVPQVQLYKCCTTLRGYIVKCQGVYLIDPTQTTTTPETTTMPYTYPQTTYGQPSYQPASSQAAYSNPPPAYTSPPVYNSPPQPAYTNPPYTNPTPYTYPSTTTETTTTTTTTTPPPIITTTSAAPCGSSPSNPCPTTTRPPTTRRHPCATCGASTLVHSLLLVLVNMSIFYVFRK